MRRKQDEIAGAPPSVRRTIFWRATAIVVVAVLGIVALNQVALHTIDRRRAEALDQGIAAAQREARVLVLLWQQTVDRIAALQRGATALAAAVARGDDAAAAAIRDELLANVRQARSEAFAEVGVVAANGELLWSTAAPAAAVADWRDREAYRAIAARGADRFVGPASLQAAPAAATTLFARALRDPTGRLQAIAFVAYRTAAANDYFTAVDPGETPLYGIWTDAGVPVATNFTERTPPGRPTRFAGRCPSATPLTDRGVASDGVARIFAANCVAGSETMVSVAVREAIWLAPAERAATMIDVLAVLASAMMALAGGLLVRSLHQAAEYRASGRREALLLADQALFRDLLDNIGDTLVKSVGETLIVEYVSLGASNLLGLAPGALIGRSLFELVDARDRAQAAERAARRPGERSMQRAQYRYRRPDGRLIWVEAESALVPSAKGITYYTALRDVTDRHEAYAALQQAKAELDTLMAIIPGVLCRTRVAADGSRRLTYVSPTIEQFTGMSPAEAMGPAGILARLDPQVLHAVDQAFDASATPGQATVEFASPAVAARRRRAHIRRVGLPDGEREEIWYIVDITDLHAAEAARHAAEQRLAELVDRSPAVLFQYVVEADGSQRALYHSPNVGRLTGYPAEVLNQPDAWQRVVDAETAARWPGVLAQALASGHAQWEYPATFADGTTRQILSSCRAERLPSGAWLITGSWLDVTAQRATELELERTRRILEAAVDAGPGVLLRIKLRTGRPPKLLYVSRALARITGYGPQDATLAEWLQTALEPAFQDAVAQAQAALLRFEPAALELYFRTRAGDWRWMQLTLRPQEHADGGGVIAVCYMLDITQQKEQSARMLHNAKLITLGELTTSLAHELNQPLAIMSMAAENAKRELEESGRIPAVMARLDRIHAQAMRASQLIEHLRVFGRSHQAGRSPVAAADAVAGALLLASAKLRQHAIDVHTAIPADLPPMLANLVLLEQVVLNLLSNACDAYRSETTADPAQRRVVEVAARAADGKVVLTVADHAGGIPPGIIERVFEPFFTTKISTKGTGVGLSFCFGVISDMGGTMRVWNADGGAVFEVAVPAAAAPAEAGEALAAAS